MSLYQNAQIAMLDIPALALVKSPTFWPFCQNSRVQYVSSSSNTSATKLFLNAALAFSLIEELILRLVYQLIQFLVVSGLFYEPNSWLPS